MSGSPGIAVVGGVYEERCMRPSWHEIFGSAGRACSAIAAFDEHVDVELHCYADGDTQQVLAARAAMERCTLRVHLVDTTARFLYMHGLARPEIELPDTPRPPLKVTASNVLRFGMIDGDAVVDGERVVYDPQSGPAPAPFGMNGSRAGRLAIVVNEGEARRMTGLRSEPISNVARAVLRMNDAAAVVLKRGPMGAIVLDGDREVDVSAWATENVWKIGSGDVFSGHFALQWAIRGQSAAESAQLASLATATYCDTGGFATSAAVAAFEAPPVVASSRYLAGRRPRVYLAAPFFTLGQLWMVEQARLHLQHFGLDVFSPYHEIGVGTADQVVEADLGALREADLVFAIVDGLDAGTLVEIGYARARGTPVIIYCESEGEESLKMMSGEGCTRCTDYVTAIYRTTWQAMAL
jgi:hypothetical protein